MGFLVSAWKVEIVGCIGFSKGVEQGIVRDIGFLIYKYFLTNVPANQVLANQVKPGWNQFLANQVESAENQSMVMTTGR